MALTFKEVSQILKLIDASQCEEVVLELEGTRLVVRRGGGTGNPASAGEGASVTSSSMPSPAVARPSTPVAASVRYEVDPGVVAVRAPMVGTFYRRPAPDAPPFVEVGTRLAKGAPLCFIEVMKLYTTIESPVAGVVEEILVEDAALIEFDQVLFTIRPD